MHFAEASTSSVVDMYFDPIQRMKASVDEDYSDRASHESALPSAFNDLSMAANDGEDDDNSTPPSDDELEREIVRTVNDEDEKQAIANFIQLFHFWNRDNPEPKPFPQSIQKFKLLPTCVPEAFPEGDDRFAEKKRTCVRLRCVRRDRQVLLLQEGDRPLAAHRLRIRRLLLGSVVGRHPGPSPAPGV